MSNSIVTTEALSYSYSTGAPILNDINLDVPKGAIYGFLGPNGSGKTTTLSLLLGLLAKQKGSITMFGRSFDDSSRVAILRRIGSLIESPSLYGHLTARENLDIYGRIYRTPASRIDEVLSIVGLTDTGKKQARRFSLGMRQRLALALCLLPRPDLLILDEPTNGLDPQGIVEFREIIRNLNKKDGVTIIVSSHILSEVERMVTHVGIIFKGSMRFQGSLSELHVAQRNQSKLLLSTSNDTKAAMLLEQMKPEISGGVLSVAYRDTNNIAYINRTLVVNDIDVYLIQPQKNNLENLFIELTSNHQ